MEKEAKVYIVTVKAVATTVDEPRRKSSRTQQIVVVVMGKKEIPATLEHIGITPTQTVEIDGETIIVTQEIVNQVLIKGGMAISNSVREDAKQSSLKNLTNKNN